MKIILAILFTSALLVERSVEGTAEAEVFKDSPKSIPEEDFEKFLETQIALHRSNRLDQQIVNATLQNHLELISNLNQAMGFLLDKIDNLQSQLEELRNSTTKGLEETNTNIQRVNNTLATVADKLHQTDTKASDALEKYKTCITNIRFGPKERSRIFEGPGYGDEKSYIITGIENHNTDEYADGAFRRRFEVYRSGNWSDAAWE